MTPMSKNMDLTVVVIAKECLPGRVKTRLSPPLSPEAAAALAQLSLTQTLNTARTLPAKSRWLVMDGTPTAHDAEGFTVVPQADGGLDERLAAIFDAVTGPMLLVGMDTPQFSAHHLAPLLADWRSETYGHDAWIGPAADGGFWALALRQPSGHLVRGVPMSTESTGQLQLERLLAAGLSVGTLTELTDMDYFDDAVGIASLIPNTPFADAVRAEAGSPRYPAALSGAGL